MKEKDIPTLQIKSEPLGERPTEELEAAEPTNGDNELQKSVATQKIDGEQIGELTTAKPKPSEAISVDKERQQTIRTRSINEPPISELPTALFETQPVQINKTKLERFAQAALALVCIVFVYFIISSLSADLLDLFTKRLKPAAKQYWPNLVAVIVIIVLGFNLYTLRGYKRIWFGIAEILFAAGIGWYAINKAFADSVSDAIVILFAALYLVGRGWVNIAIRVRHLQIEQTPDDD